MKFLIFGWGLTGDRSTGLSEWLKPQKVLNPILFFFFFFFIKPKYEKWSHESHEGCNMKCLGLCPMVNFQRWMHELQSVSLLLYWVLFGSWLYISFLWLAVMIPLIWFWWHSMEMLFLLSQHNFPDKFEFYYHQFTDGVSVSRRKVTCLSILRIEGLK